jgi:FAD/FMN-containing dehydrogenase
MVDANLLNFVDQQNPNQLKNIVTKPFHKIVLLIEYDNHNERNRKKSAKRAIKILNKHKAEYQLETDPSAQEKLWKIRHSAALAIASSKGGKKALPIIEDGVVPVDKLSQLIEGVYKMFNHYRLDVALWGHAGNGNIHMQPFLDLGQVGDRQKMFKLMNEYYDLVVSLGGSTTGEHGDGRLRAP